MKSYFTTIFLLVSVVYCNAQQYKSEKSDTFSDNKKIGKPHKNKIKLAEYQKADKNLVEIKFYSLDNNKKWKLKQNIQLEKFGGLPLRPEIKDFNNDGFQDITFISGIAARGANEIRTLFIYDKKKDELLHIKNSADYPNLQYNKELNCLDAWAFYGGVRTIFLKIVENKLQELASIEHFGNTRTIYIVDKNGKQKLLRKDKIKDDGFPRYKTFNPPQTY